MRFELTPTALRDLDAVPVGWARARLDQVTEIFDCPHSTPKLTAAGPYLIRTQDIRTGVIRLGEVARVSEETYLERTKRAEPQFGDLLYSREGTYFGVAAEVPCGEKVCLGQRMVHLRPAKELNSRFLKYWLNSPLMARHISGLRDGSVAERLNMSTVRSLPVAYPELRDQQKIAEVLGALDDRIEILRDSNLSLEAIAQALFKSWFLDFDPVRAKAEGREPEGMDAATAALFPSEFEDSELGPMPKGWHTGALRDLVELKYGKALKASERGHGSVPVYGSGGITGTHDSALVSGPTIIVGRKGTVGTLYWQSAPCFPIDTVFYVVPRKSLHFSYSAMQRMGLQDLNTDAAVPGLNRENAYRQTVVIPPDSLLQAWDKVAVPIRQQIDGSEKRSQTLRTIRDTLLPRLISGKLRLPEAKALVEEAIA